MRISSYLPKATAAQSQDRQPDRLPSGLDPTQRLSEACSYIHILKLQMYRWLINIQVRRFGLFSP